MLLIVFHKEYVEPGEIKSSNIKINYQYLFTLTDVPPLLLPHDASAESPSADAPLPLPFFPDIFSLIVNRLIMKPIKRNDCCHCHVQYVK